MIDRVRVGSVGEARARGYHGMCRYKGQAFRDRTHAVAYIKLV